MFGIWWDSSEVQKLVGRFEDLSGGGVITGRERNDRVVG